MKELLIITSIFFLVSFALVYLYQLRKNKKITKAAHKSLMAMLVLSFYIGFSGLVDMPKQLARQDELELVVGSES